MRSPFSHLRFGGLLGLSARQWRRAVDARLESYDLSEATWVPLLHLARSDAPMRQRDLAQALSLDSSSVVRILKQLEAMGLIERGEDDADRRAKALVVTAAGRALAGKLESISECLQREVLSGLPAEDLAVARRTMEAICSRLLALNAAPRVEREEEVATR